MRYRLVGKHVFLRSIANPQPRPFLIEIELSLTMSGRLFLVAPRPVRFQLAVPPVQLLPASLPKLEEINPAAVQTTHKNFTQSLPDN